MIDRSIAVVSGKGGAGKTMLSMAITHELALRSRILIVDLDVFNRGLSGLLTQGKKVADVPVPRFLTPEGPVDLGGGAWTLIEPAPNVVTLHFPDITREQRQQMESLSIGALSEQLAEFIQDLLTLSGCTSVVLDCHGGPDILSFAAVSIAAHTILVSEPDRITFYGTLHFLRRMAEDCPRSSPDVRLVFNKVMPAFSERYLRTFYNNQVKDLFQDNKLLAVVPFEEYLSKEFERFPFVTQAYPYSMLAAKAREIVKELNIDGAQSRRRALGNWERIADDWLGSGARFVPRFMNLDATLAITAVTLTVLVLVNALTSQPAASDGIPGPLQNLASTVNSYSLPAGLLVALWFVSVIAINWISVLDRVFTREFRRRNFLFAIPVFFVIEPLSWAPAAGAGGLLGSILSSATDPSAKLASLFMPSLTDKGSMALALYLCMFVTLWMFYNLIVRVWIAVRHEKRYGEGVWRVLGCLSGIAIFVIMLVAVFKSS